MVSTVRENTERLETVAFGSNVLVKMSEERSFESYLLDREDNPNKENIELWMEKHPLEFRRFFNQRKSKCFFL